MNPQVIAGAVMLLGICVIVVATLGSLSLVARKDSIRTAGRRRSRPGTRRA